MKSDEFKTIKVSQETINNLNLIAAHKDGRQYLVVDRLAKEEIKKLKIRKQKK